MELKLWGTSGEDHGAIHGCIQQFLRFLCVGCQVAALCFLKSQ
uniref:Uncharacterized protein n=1 Tax=Anguilla anguilla TaxID=7936 RepID=A0A0E9R0N0_ANGAN